MSITPLTLQMTVPMTQDVTPVEKMEQTKASLENFQAQHQVNKDTARQHQTVVKKDKNEFTEYRYDAKNKGNGKYQDNRKKKKQEDQNTDDKENKRVVSIDIQL